GVRHLGFVLGPDFLHGESACAGVRRLQERQPIAQASVADSGVLQDHKSGSGHTKVGIASAGQESQKLFSVRWTREYAEGLQSAGRDLGRTRGIDARSESSFATRILHSRPE